MLTYIQNQKSLYDDVLSAVVDFLTKGTQVLQHW